MASGNKSHLYPNFQANREIHNKNGEPIHEAQVDLLSAQDQLVQDVSSTAVLTPAYDDDLVGEPQDLDDRGNWGGRFDFLMSLLGYSVGLGNVWRFPYLAYMNGGGAFLFPFILMFLLLGFPLMFMELSFGQFAALGPAAIFDRICPILNGLGFGMMAVTSMVGLYYTVIIAWAFLYLFKSLTSELPWERCGDWAGINCHSHLEASECAAVNGSIYYQTKCFNATEAARRNLTSMSHNTTQSVVPAQDYFEREILNISGGIDEIGSIRYEIMGCLALTWFLTFCALSRGVKSMGKVVYFTALFPYLVLTILFFRGVTLDGSMDGIIYYLTPQFDKLIEAKTWVAAAVQIFFALSPAWGGLITLSSYNKFHNDCFKDSLIVGVGNICTSIFAGFVIFGIVGYLAKELDMPVSEVVAQGPGLAFIVFPDVVTRLPLPPFWSFLFFFMLITLGMGSEFALLETIMTAIQDTYPPLRQKKAYVVATVAVIGFFGGLVICTEGGMFVMLLMDTYAASWAVFLMAILECVIIAWIYGADRFLRDIEMMIGRKSKPWHMFFTFFWKFLTPSTLVFLLLFNFFDYNRMSYQGKVYPLWAEFCGWFMACIPIAIILFFAALKFIRTSEFARSSQDNTFKQKLVRLFQPTPKWGPAHKVPKFDLEEGEKKAKSLTNPNFGPGGETRI